MARSTRRAAPAFAEALAEGPDALGTLRVLVIVPEDESRWSSFAVALRWDGELRLAQWIHRGHAKTPVRRWFGDRLRESAQGWPVPVGQVRALVEAALARSPSPVAAALVDRLAREPAQPVSSPAPLDAGLHPNEARAALSEWPFVGRLVLSWGDLAALGIELPAAPLDARAFEAWARDASGRLDVPALRERIERIARVGAFMLHHRGDARMAGQLVAWAEVAARDGTREHPLALALLRNTLALEPDGVHEPSTRHAERARLAQRVTSGYTVGDMLRVELAARLFAGVAAALEHELLSERVPRYDVLRAFAAALVDEALRRGPRAAASDVAMRSRLAGIDDAVAERMAAVSRDVLGGFADEVERDPAMAWATRDPGETLPQHWFTHGRPG